MSLAGVVALAGLAGTLFVLWRRSVREAESLRTALIDASRDLERLQTTLIEDRAPLPQ